MEVKEFLNKYMVSAEGHNVNIKDAYCLYCKVVKEPISLVAFNREAVQLYAMENKRFVGMKLQKPRKFLHNISSADIREANRNGFIIVPHDESYRCCTVCLHCGRKFSFDMSAMDELEVYCNKCKEEHVRKLTSEERIAIVDNCIKQIMESEEPTATKAVARAKRVLLSLRMSEMVKIQDAFM